MEIDAQTAQAMLEWQVELGADEAIGDVPINRYELPEKRPAAVADAPVDATKPEPASGASGADPVAVARQVAEGAPDLAGLESALAAYEHCDLKKGARRTVFADGNPAARVMVIGEAPGREEDERGKPFVGDAGRLLDKMFAAIGLDRGADSPDAALYITNIVPWRPPQNRDPQPDEIEMMLPFIRRHITLADPQIVVLMGNIACQALLGRRGITRLRGTWTEVLGRPALPMFHPAYLIRNPIMKREAWADLQAIRTRMKGD